ncbi:MAG: ABC transporter permease [Vulcanimicrobiaceae bacterium]
MLDTSKTRAIVRRDARLTVATFGTVWRSWASIVGQVVTFYFLSKLIVQSPIFGVDGRPVPYFDYVAINLAFLRFAAAAIGSFQRAVRGDQMMGTIEAMLVTPTSLSLLVVSSAIWSFVLTFLQMALFLACATFLGLDLHRVDLVTVGTFLALTVLALSPLGILSAATVMIFKQAAPTSALVGGFASLLSGTLFPIAKLPAFLQLLSWLLPITHALNGLRGGVGGASVSAFRGDALWLAIMAVVCMPLALVVFTRAVRRAKMDGTLGDY